ncbi:MAG TPA: hypothetical protein VFQ39_01210 [Longimicrobium sp.]|nr:hypothetical protein [Longimicrobium sp.]
MTLTLDLPSELERKLVAEAEKMGLPLDEYALRLLASRATGATARTGAEAVAFWKAEGVIGALPDVADPSAHARRLRQQR